MSSTAKLTNESNRAEEKILNFVPKAKHRQSANAKGNFWGELTNAVEVGAFRGEMRILRSWGVGRVVCKATVRCLQRAWFNFNPSCGVVMDTYDAEIITGGVNTSEARKSTCGSTGRDWCAGTSGTCGSSSGEALGVVYGVMISLTAL